MKGGRACCWLKAPARAHRGLRTAAVCRRPKRRSGWPAFKRPVALTALGTANVSGPRSPPTTACPLRRARDSIEVRAAATAARRVPQVAAHGDFWWGNLLLTERRELAVVDWSEFRLDAHPFHDAGFYLLTWGRDWAQGRERLAPADWLTRAFTPESTFRAAAERWFARYRAALARTSWSRLLPADFAALLQHLPLVMAHYACHGQQADAWTTVCNAWADADSLPL